MHSTGPSTSAMHEPKLSMSSKGKAREDTHWQLGWWDLASTSSPRKPLAWSPSSLLLRAHPSQPLVLVSHFPSGRQFVLPSPQPLLTATAAYGPPTIIAVCPTDDWCFAFFPGRGGDGVGCLWKRGAQLDNWSVRDCFSFPSKAGVVAAEWTCAHREWVVSEAGSSSRVPPRGPISPHRAPTLVLVTQDHFIHIYFIPPHVQPGAKSMRASLLRATVIADPKETLPPEASGGPGGDRVCINATIGLGYNDSTMVVAMRSHLLPPQHADRSLHDPMGLGLPLEMAHGSAADDPFASEWDMWGEDPTIQLCEVHLDYKNVPRLVTKPINPLLDTPAQLAEFRFVYEPPMSPLASPTKDPRKLAKGIESGPFLVATFLDFGDYTAPPKSEIQTYSFQKKESPSGSGVSGWVPRSEAKRIFEDKVVSFIVPSMPKGAVLAGFLDLHGSIPSRRSKIRETIIGHVSVLRIPDLRTDEQWDTSPLVARVDHLGQHTPLSVAVSPNHTLLCTLPSATLGVQLCIHPVPHRRPHTLAPSRHPQSDLARALVHALRARYSFSDVTHVLSLPTAPLEAISQTLYHALTLLSLDSNGLLDMWTANMLSAATEVYLARAKKVDGEEKDQLTQSWKFAHDIASLSACCSAFEDCQEGDEYDLDAVWQLVGVSGWLIEMLERLLRLCIVTGHASDAPQEKTFTFEDTASSISPLPSLDAPDFLLLGHPFALSRLYSALMHVKRFRDQVTSLSPKGENAYLARDTLIDIVGNSGIDLGALSSVLHSFMQETNFASAEDLRLSLAACCPTPSLKPHLRKIAEKIQNSDVVDRPRLFIKPADLVDGVNRLSMEAQPAKEKGIDVVSKGLLPRRNAGLLCARCGGRSETAETSVGVASVRWRIWEKSWMFRCVCGGSWLRANPPI
ncbi:hypothetical protein CERSUDRAFT_113104 [Gelatoporia subvermispora B]|uniref:Mediator complex subunit 16 C-terminal domain-containing protein n=1 Tax=Ceriporiopsis subvermispora (strain B) TaxID=914234 RepID=M2PNJ1_CERS8|nr:hypothetical protein CERSUDRAFT_113104 [Gelatoporia subvermispora B]